MNKVGFLVFFFKQKTAYEILSGLVGSEMCIETGTGPTSAIVASVYPNENISKKATAARNARMDKAAHRRKSAEMHQGEVILKLVR